MATTAAIAAAFARVRAAGFVGKATRLADIDLPQIGHQIGVGEDEVHAVIDVETAGGGFDKLTRPKMLFEPHKMFAALTGAKRTQAVSLGLAYPTWGEKPYPSDSYPRLAQAMAIDETAALASASWGLGQILGSNFIAAGYDSPQQMVLAFVEGGESEHLSAMVRFIKANHLDDELRAHNWPAFARGYNGPKYAANGYHTKLAAAFARWAKIPDTAWSPAAAGVAVSAPTIPVEAKPLAPVLAGPLVAPAPRNSGVSLAPAPRADDLKPATVQTGGLGGWLKSLFSKKAA